MATSPELHEPQIAAARAQAWHQAGEALLTLEAARTWINEYGLVLFASRGVSLGAPAPSLVEATMGAAKATATLAEIDTARTLTARLVGEGSALPLNLLGGPGDLPDFLVSAQAFPFIFTLRGDKGWKRPPETSGAVKVTPLGLSVYELLAERGGMTIAQLLPEIGREVTESAIARALSELWQLLRVIPVLQQGEGETVWELTTARFLKGIKAGANAGQPTALSALASLYLSQVLVASEEEIAGFLSPLTARSRVRDVLHGLIAGRQLAEGVVNGKTVLYMPEALPDFSQFAEPEAESETDAAEASEGVEGIAPAADGEPGEAAPRERIRSFGGDKSKPQDRNLRGKPVSREGAKRAPFRADSARSKPPGSGRDGERRPPRADRSGDGPRPARPYGADRERPARRDSPSAGYQGRSPASRGSSFSKPWDEERASRPPRPRPAGGFGDDRPPRPSRPRRDSAEGETRDSRPPRSFSDRGDSRPPRREGDRPFRPRDASAGAGGAENRRPAPRGDRPDRPYRPRPEGGERPFRPRPRSEEGDRPSFRPRAAGGDRPFRPNPGGGERPYRAKPAGGDRPYRPKPRGEEGDRPFRPRPRAEGGDRPFRPREGAAREGGAGERRGPGRPAGGGFGRSDRGPGRSEGARGPRPGGRPGFGAGKKAPGKFPGKPRTDGPPRPPRSEDEA